jgi:hypothetical protein
MKRKHSSSFNYTSIKTDQFSIHIRSIFTDSFFPYPFQMPSKSMGDTAFLKREMGDNLVFAGEIDTVNALFSTDPQKVNDGVKRRHNDLVLAADMLWIRDRTFKPTCC